MLNRQITAWTTLALTMILTGGCATVVSGRMQGVPVETKPPGADVQWSDGHAVTPAKVELRRAEFQQLMVTKEGYHPVEVTLRRELNAMTIGNVVAGGIVGLLVDEATDANKELHPKRVDLILEPVMPGEKPTLRRWQNAGYAHVWEAEASSAKP